MANHPGRSLVSTCLGIGLFALALIAGPEESLAGHTFDPNLTIDSGDEGPDSLFEENSAGSLWPNAQIPFVVESNGATTLVSQVLDAIAYYHFKTRIRFVPRSTETNYVAIVYDPTIVGGQSKIAMVGGKQLVRIGSINQATIRHELGHAIGLHHEHKRKDRDQYIRVHFANVIPEKLGNFVAIPCTGAPHGPYDYDSIMHYRKYSFSLNKLLPTITGPGVPLFALEDELSAGDVQAIDDLYTFRITTPARKLHVIDAFKCDLTVSGFPVASIPVAFLNVYRTKLRLAVAELYSSLLGREADSTGLESWVHEILYGASYFRDVRFLIATSEESRQRVTWIYRAILGREPDAPGIDGFLYRYLPDGGTLQGIRKIAAHSPESAAKIRRLYSTLLEREATNQDLQGWQTYLEHYGILAELRRGIAQSQEARSKIVRIYSEVLRRTPAASEVSAWTDFLERYGTLADARSRISQSPEAVSKRGATAAR